VEVAKMYPRGSAGRAQQLFKTHCGFVQLICIFVYQSKIVISLEIFGATNFFLYASTAEGMFPHFINLR
jgi:hypothetical protein